MLSLILKSTQFPKTINLKPLYLKTKGKLPKAISKMYSDLASVKYKTENVDKKIINSLKNDGFMLLKILFQTRK